MPKYKQKMARLILCCLFLINCLVSAGQQTDSIHPKIFPFEFGFLLGLNHTVSKNKSLGYHMGMSAEYQTGCNKICLRGQLLISFMDYDTATSTGTKTVETTIIDFPLHVLFKPFRSKISPVISAGLSSKIDLSFRKNYLLSGQEHFPFFVDIAIGFEGQLRYFKISPELRYSYGHSLQIFYLTLNLKR
jgi:hypothetical protein